jgi:hypothetical protein
MGSNATLSIPTPGRRGRLAAAAVVAGLTLAACGGDDGGETTAEETTVTPAVALTEIDQVEQGLADAEAAYRKGDADRAEELAGTAYLEHFELVEGPLEEADEELNEHLEELIREELRTAITDGAPVSQVEALVDEANAGLDDARKALKQ